GWHAMTRSASLSTRSALGFIGLAVAVAVALILPLGYALFEYDERSEVLAFKAQLGAERVAKYVYGREKLWQYQSVRLDELLQLPAGSTLIRQRVEDASGRTVFDSGQAIECPGFST